MLTLVVIIGLLIFSTSFVINLELGILTPILPVSKPISLGNILLLLFNKLINLI